MISELVGFLGGHWVLSLGFFISLGIAIYLEQSNSRKGERLVDNNELVDIINSKGVGIDLRSKDDFEQGHIVGTQNMSADKMLVDNVFLKKNKDKDVILICEKGNYSWMIMKGLVSKGFKSVRCLEQGYNGWLKASLPVVSGKK